MGTETVHEAIPRARAAGKGFSDRGLSSDEGHGAMCRARVDEPVSATIAFQAN
ncbi:hypothetical protein [Austwickia chelonae]|uniref:Uncharacterized protein n=1 Tax=Austwickia chelonae NBRC 105200 TaxID=1184607 RepID=K6UNL8_9MICO|nr:hypothetical protein [Austwickia chelonae]GAB79076.1 hypothetical protein AUCHE_18_00760 [Austwickia chelonae NBRC 105200]